MVAAVMTRQELVEKYGEVEVLKAEARERALLEASANDLSRQLIAIRFQLARGTQGHPHGTCPCVACEALRVS